MMILVHRLRGEPMLLNADLIESIEATPRHRHHARRWQAPRRRRLRPRDRRGASVDSGAPCLSPRRRPATRPRAEWSRSAARTHPPQPIHRFPSASTGLGSLGPSVRGLRSFRGIVHSRAVFMPGICLFPGRLRRLGRRTDAGRPSSRRRGPYPAPGCVGLWGCGRVLWGSGRWSAVLRRWGRYPAPSSGPTLGLSASTISRLIENWTDEHQAFEKRDLSGDDFVYVWADGVHFRIRLEEDRLCALVMIGVRCRRFETAPGLRRWVSGIGRVMGRGAAGSPGPGHRGPSGSGWGRALGFWKALGDPGAALLGAQDRQHPQRSPQTAPPLRQSGPARDLQGGDPNRRRKRDRPVRAGLRR